MKILTAHQLFEADKITLKSQNITAVQLMERAADLAFQHLMKRYKNQVRKFNVLCGIGNNGGDGLVMARKLMEQGFDFEVFVCEYSTKRSHEFEENLKILQAQSPESIHFLNEESAFPEWENDAVFIDAIFGIGLNRAMPNWISKMIAFLNHKKVEVIAIDIPSGLYANQAPEENQPILKATKTFTFQSPKLSFFLPQTASYVGEWEVIDIGLDRKHIQNLSTDFETIDPAQLQNQLKSRPQFSHKGTFGHALVIGGSYGMMGSMVLATRAALRSGAGKVTAWIPQCGYAILQTSVPEAMVLTTEEETYLSDYQTPNFDPSAIGFGMGAGIRKQTADFLEQIMKDFPKPMLIDADGLNILSKYRDLMDFIPKDSVLTPHPKELERLIGKWKNDFEKMALARDFAKQYQINLIVKGAYTLLVTPHKTYINTTGNPGMATAGSGDVLSGLITGLMAQGYPAEVAAKLGIWLHGKAGDIAKEKSGEEFLIAGDLILKFGAAFKALRFKSEKKK